MNTAGVDPPAREQKTCRSMGIAIDRSLPQGAATRCVPIVAAKTPQKHDPPALESPSRRGSKTAQSTFPANPKTRTDPPPLAASLPFVIPHRHQSSCESTDLRIPCPHGRRGAIGRTDSTAATTPGDESDGLGPGRGYSPGEGERLGAREVLPVDPFSDVDREGVEVPCRRFTHGGGRG